MSSVEEQSLPDFESSDKVCGNCNFFSSMTMECRYDPPTPEGEESGWPNVQKTDWCGKFQHSPAGTFGTKHELLSRSAGG
jgi:hypothetical protein